MQALGASLPQFLLDGVIKASRTYIFLITVLITLVLIQEPSAVTFLATQKSPPLPCDRFVFPSADTFFPYLSFLTLPYLPFFSVLSVCLCCSQAVEWCALSICATSARSGRVESHASRFVTILLSYHPSFLLSFPSYFSLVCLSQSYLRLYSSAYLSIYVCINMQMIFSNSGAISDCICCEDYAVML